MDVQELFSKNPEEKFHYTEVAKRCGVSESSANAACNRLFQQGFLMKPRAGQFVFKTPEPDHGKEDPWDMNPPSPDQTLYFDNLLSSLREGWTSIDTTIASSVLTHLNNARKAAGIPFKEYE